MRLFAVIFALLCSHVLQHEAAAVQELTLEDMKNLLRPLPADEWQPFITTNVNLGYRVKFENEAWENAEEADLAVEIFDYFMNNQEAIRERKQLLNGGEPSICYPSIGCIDTDDPALRP